MLAGALTRGTGLWLEHRENGWHSLFVSRCRPRRQVGRSYRFPRVLEHPYDPVNGTAKYLNMAGTGVARRVDIICKVKF